MVPTRLQRRIDAVPEVVYQALLDADDVRRWMVPDGMRSEVHHFEGREGGTFRISLTYDEPTATGKSGVQTDTFHGRFVRLVPHREVVQEVEFESGDPAMQGVMRISYLLEADGARTVVTGLHEDLPPGLSEQENQLGWEISMGKLAALVEQRSRSGPLT